MAARDENGGAICAVCYRRPKHKCDGCGRFEGATAWDENDKPLCQTCYTKLGYRPRHTCIECNEEAPAALWNDAGNPVCGECYKSCSYAPLHECVNCNEVQPSDGQTEKGEPLCRSCYSSLRTKPKKLCGGCNKEKSTVRQTEEGLRCGTCYHGFACDAANCEYTPTAARIVEHARNHSTWAWKSRPEETIYKALVALGFERAWPGLNPPTGPAKNTFWYNARVFTKLGWRWWRSFRGRFLYLDLVIIVFTGLRFMDRSIF